MFREPERGCSRKYDVVLGEQPQLKQRVPRGVLFARDAQHGFDGLVGLCDLWACWKKLGFRGRFILAQRTLMRNGVWPF